MRCAKSLFVLYKEGLIYEDQYIINWCPRCKTALADLEVEYEEKDAYLYYIRYPFKKGGKKGLTVCHHPAGNHVRGHCRGRESGR